MYIARYLKAFALTGRQVCVRNYPGRCPGLGASALSGRAASGASALSGRAASGAFGSSGRAASGASALYLCFTLRPAIFNSLRSVTVGSGRAASGAFGLSARPCCHYLDL